MCNYLKKSFNFLISSGLSVTSLKHFQRVIRSLKFHEILIYWKCMNPDILAALCLNQCVPFVDFMYFSMGDVLKKTSCTKNECHSHPTFYNCHSYDLFHKDLQEIKSTNI